MWASDVGADVPVGVSRGFGCRLAFLCGCNVLELDGWANSIPEAGEHEDDATHAAFPRNGPFSCEHLSVTP